MTSVSVVCLSHAIVGKVGLVESPGMHHKMELLITHLFRMKVVLIGDSSVRLALVDRSWLDMFG